MDQPKPDCSNLPKSDNKPDNDIIGIDIGMSADDVLKLARCTKAEYTVEVIEDNSVTLPDGTHPRGGIEMRNENEGDRINVYVVGVPDKERVIGIVREKAFAAGQEPTIEQMRATLTEKYGSVTTGVAFGTQEGSRGNRMAQAFAPDGTPLPGNMVGDWDCTDPFGQNNNLGQMAEACGFTKKVVIATAATPGLASRFGVWIGDQHEFFVAARRTVAAIEAMHRQKEEAARQDAAASDRTPDL